MTPARVDDWDLRIWIAGGALAFALHAAFALRIVQWHDRIPGDEGSEAVLIDLTPSIEQQHTLQDLAPGPQEEAQPQPAPPDEAPQAVQKTDEPLPVMPNADAVLPKPAEKPVHNPKFELKRAARVTTAPPRPHPSPAQVSNWHRQIAIQLERHKSYPAEARAQGETGVATVAFAIGRDGRLLSSRLVFSSHAAPLDEEALATVRRASPFPPPPVSVPGSRFDFTLPIRFNIR